MTVGEFAMCLALSPMGQQGQIEADIGHPYFSMVSTVGLDRVSGDRLTRFIRADMSARRQMFVAWKREENEARFLKDEKVCSRCNRKFKAYKNNWNRAGCCSRKCFETSGKLA